MEGEKSDRKQTPVPPEAQANSHGSTLSLELPSLVNTHDATNSFRLSHGMEGILAAVGSSTDRSVS